MVLGASNSKSDRRLKSGHTFTLRSKEPLNLSDEVSDESIDFEDVVPPKKTFKSRGSKRGRTSERFTKKTTEQVSSQQESQEFAESASFVSSSNNYKSGYLYEQPIYVPDVEAENSTQVANVTSPQKSDPEFNGYNYRQQTKSPRKLEPNTLNDQFFATTTVAPSTSSRRGTTTYKNQKSIRFNQDVQSAVRVTDEKRKSVTTSRRIQTSRTTPYYTPTVPSIIQRPSSAPHLSQRSAFQESVPTTETPPAAEHAIEMMRTLHELHLDTMQSNNNYSQDASGLVVPPSSGPDTLHSLALYFATAVDNLVTKSETTPKAEPAERTEKSLDVSFGNVTNVASTLVSNKTINKFEKLFRLEGDSSNQKVETATDAKVDNRVAADETNDLDTDYSTNPILAAAGSPQIRELAQVFTHALSAYLHDPSTFRRVLSEIRPTEPPALQQNNDIVSNRIGRTEDFNRGSGATYLPTQPILTATPSSLLPTTEDLEVLDFSDVTVSTLKKESFYPSTTPSTYADSTTNNAFEADQTTLTPFNSVNQALKSADRVPASRYLTEQLEKSAQASRQAKAFTQTSETKNPIAMEINGGLIESTSFPYFQDDSLETNSNNTFADTNYFPVDSDEEVNSTARNVYGADLSTGAPISNNWDKPSDYSFPNRWGWDATTEPSPIETTVYPPSGLAFELLPPNNNRKGFALPLGEILPPNADENDLQHAQSQSLVASGNQLIREREKLLKETSKTNYYTETSTHSQASGHYITHTFDAVTPSPDQLPRSTLPDTGRISTSAWSTLSYTVFLDPHTINDGLQNAVNTVTPSPNTYLPRTSETPNHSEYSTETSTFDHSIRQGKEYLATDEERPQEYMEVMQKKANEMFGGLNDTSASHLMNVMKKAPKSKTVRKLILLLIQTCDDDYNTTVEQSRTALLNALIGMDGKLIDDESEIQIISSPRRSKSLPSGGPNQLFDRSTSTETPITTFRRPFYVAKTTTSEPQYLFESTSTQQSVEPFETTTYRDYDEYRTTYGHGSAEETTTGEYSASTTESSTTNPSWAPIFHRRSPDTTTTTTSTTTTTTKAPFELPIAKKITQQRADPLQTSSSQSKRIAKDLDDLLGQASQSYDPSLTSNRANKFSDTRALDLLRSLYSLAGRFGRR